MCYRPHGQRSATKQSCKALYATLLSAATHIHPISYTGIQSTEHGWFARPYALHSPPNLLSQTLRQERRCSRNVADTAVRLYPNCGYCRQGSAERVNIRSEVLRLLQTHNTVPTLLQTLSSKVPKSCNWNKPSYTRWTLNSHEPAVRQTCSVTVASVILCVWYTSRPLSSGRVMSPSVTFGMRKRIWGFSLAQMGGTFRKCFYYYQHIVTTMYIQAGKIIYSQTSVHELNSFPKVVRKPKLFSP